MKHIHLKIYIISTVLLDLLDETDGDTRFKHKLRYNINRTIEELEKITKHYSNDETNQLVCKIWNVVEKELSTSLNQNKQNKDEDH